MKTIRFEYDKNVMLDRFLFCTGSCVLRKIYQGSHFFLVNLRVKGGSLVHRQSSQSGWWSND